MRIARNKKNDISKWHKLSQDVLLKIKIIINKYNLRLSFYQCNRMSNLIIFKYTEHILFMCDFSLGTSTKYFLSLSTTNEAILQEYTGGVYPEESLFSFDSLEDGGNSIAKLQNFT